MNASELQEIISQVDKPVVVDFWAPWCVPCNITKPTLETLAKEYAGAVKFVQVNADTSPEIVDLYEIYGIPTLLAFRNNQILTRVSGARNKTSYKTLFESLAKEKAIQAPVAPFDRLLRIGSGAIVGGIGMITSNWWLLGIGGLVVFWGLYDRCPIWAALKKKFGRK